MQWQSVTINFYKIFYLIASSVWTNELFILNVFENDKIISQFVSIIKSCDQTGDGLLRAKKDTIFVLF